MRLHEFATPSKNNPESSLTTALELIRNRYKDQDKLPKIKTQSLINLVLNTDKTFDYDALVDANENNPAVQNLIKSFNKDYVEINPAGEADEAPISNVDGKPASGPVDTVDNMAKRAAKKRDSDLF